MHPFCIRPGGLSAALLACLTPLALAQSPAPAEASKGQQHFDIMEFRVLGNSLLPIRSVERSVYPFLGPERDLDVVKQAVAALEKSYKDAGFGTVFVDIPEQSVDEGVVRLQVTEGRLDRVNVSGARYLSGRRILSQLPALQPGETPNLQAFQRQLNEVNSRSADLTVTPILKPGSEPGTVDVNLKTRDDLPLHGSIEANNRYSANTTPNRVAVAASYDNLWQLNHGLSLFLQWAPAAPSEAGVGAATYIWRLQSSPAMWSFGVVETNSNVAAVGTLGVLGKGTIYSVHWLDPVVNTESTSHTVTLGADLKDFEEDIQLSNSPQQQTPITYVNWLAQYSGAWRYPTHTFGFSASVEFGVRGLVNHPDEFEAKRFDAPADYFYLRSSGQMVQALPWGFAALVRYGGQYSPTPLIDNEQFALGGLDTVRGYVEAEALGDYGIAGTLELHSPPLGARGGNTLRSLYAFLFGDAGVASIEEPLPSQQARAHLESIGFGLRLEGGSSLQGTLDYALPLSTGPYTKRGDSRFDFVIHYGF